MKQLTIIIPFKNERDQVLKTCLSFNEHGNPALFDILCLNDCSDAGYDYSELSRVPNVTLVDNPERLGVAGSRDKGATLATTPYLLFVDGHMRVFSDVVTPLVEKLHSYPETLLCCQSRVIRFNKQTPGYEIERTPRTKGVRLNSSLNPGFLDYRWDTLTDADALREVIPIQCCMGACYAIGREYYLYLHGLNGLQQWGMDEQFLSAKVWMNGSRVLLLKNIEIAHIYRTGTPVPYRSNNGIKLLNQLIVAYLLGDERLFLPFREDIRRSLRYQLNKEVVDVFDDLLPFLQKEKIYLNLVLKQPFTYFLNLSQNGE